MMEENKVCNHGTVQPLSEMFHVILYSLDLTSATLWVTFITTQALMFARVEIRVFFKGRFALLLKRTSWRKRQTFHEMKSEPCEAGILVTKFHIRYGTAQAIYLKETI